MDYRNLPFMCSNCEKPGCNLGESKYVHQNMQDEGICMKCFDELSLNGMAKRFLISWLDNPRDLDVNIYELPTEVG